MRPENPLLDDCPDIPFDRIRAEHVAPAIDTLIAEARARLAAIVDSAEPPTFANTAAELDVLTERLDTALGWVAHLESVATTPELRQAYSEVLPRVSEFHTSIVLDERLYARLQALAASREAASLPGHRARFLKTTLDRFRREGADLDSAARARLVQINRELAAATNEFSQNQLDATSAWSKVVSEDRLRGVPERVRAALAADAAAHHESGLRLSLQAPCLLAILSYADDSELRRELYLAHNTRASSPPYDNRPLVRRILELRRAKANLLGYKDFADYVLADRMARNGATAAAFVADLERRSRPYFVREQEELVAYWHELTGKLSDPAPWDIAWIAEKMRKARFALDSEELRPYFPVESVLRGMFEIAFRVFGVRIHELVGDERPPVWHDDVRVFTLDDDTRKRAGVFYVDLYPREGKRDGAWMNHFRTGGVRGDGSFAPHVGLLAANVTPPQGARPALLDHGEVETIFHEFGHLLHHLLSRCELKSQSGTRVAWDFVELPSQMMENWCWKREALDLFARHVDSGAPIPDELFGRLTAARNFHSAIQMMRQLGLATLDLMLHRDYDESRDGDVVGWANRILNGFTPARVPPEAAMILSFSHLFADPVAYGAGYYSYKWAEVLDADAFAEFEREGVFSREVGRRFVEQILARGDSDDPAALFRSFAGRDPNPEALLRRSGLAG